jgi:hypothetical protein
MLGLLGLGNLLACWLTISWVGKDVNLMSTTILILTYWIGTGLVIAAAMYFALQFANFCAYVVDFFIRKK